MKIEIYTDGSCIGNESKESLRCGAWSIVVLENGIKKYQETGKVILTTNNRMELCAFLEALKYISEMIGDKKSNPDETVIIYSDSAYTVNCINYRWYVNWRRNDWTSSSGECVKNINEWIELIDLWIKLASQIKISVILVKGHSGNKWNELANSLAIEESEKYEKFIKNKLSECKTPQELLNAVGDDVKNRYKYFEMKYYHNINRN